MTNIEPQPTAAASSASDYALIRFGHISAFTANCKRVRYRRNDCRQCVTVCPDQAVSLNPGPKISPACTQCGLCVAACPTEVFRDEDSPEQHLWKQAVELKASISSTRHKTLSLNCHQVTQPSSDALAVYCLGSISASFLAALAFLGYDELKLERGVCSQCHLKSGDKLSLNSVQVARTFLHATKHTGCIIQLETSSPCEVLSARRRFLSPLATAFRIIKRASGKTAKAAPNSPTGRMLLYQLLASESARSLPPIPYCPDLPFAAVTIDETLCSGCGICTAVCPTGALVENLESSCKVLRFSSALCLNCRLCSEVCPKSAVRFQGEFTPLMYEGKVVAKVKMSECWLCGDTTWAPNDGLCPTCERRQLSHLCRPRRNNPVDPRTESPSL